MIDTIKGYIELNQYKSNDFKHLLVDSVKTIRKNGYTKTINLSNLKITFSFDKKNKPIKLFFCGSLPKFYQENNLTQMSWNETKNAIQMLSDNIGVDISKAILTRVDFGVNIQMNHPVHEYISCLLSFPRLGTMRFKETVKFLTSNNSKSYLFYDKIKEVNKNSRKTSNNIHKDLLDKNILRYEVQLNGFLKNRFRLKRVRVKDLFRNSVQVKIINYWFNGYHKIEKISLGIDPDFLLNKRDGLKKYLSYHGIEKVGRDRLEYKISSLNFNVENNSVKKSKIRASIRKIINEVKENCVDKNLITELDEKILEIKLSSNK